MSDESYYNFDLIIERVGEKYRARVFDSPTGQASAEFELPFSELELENFVLRMGRSRSGVRRVDSTEMEAVKQLGERLFRAIFTDDVYACFLRSRDSALEDEKGLRVRLRIDVPEFHDYPWEFLYNAHLNQFLALSKDTPVVRYLELPYPLQPLTVQPPLNILVMISSPQGFPQLNVEEEWTRLNTALAPLLRRGLVTLERLKRPTLSALQQNLRRGEYHIFHFVGHGKFSEHKQDGMLLLEEENGQGRPVSGQYLGTVLHDHRSLRLVVLNACEGARTSQEDPYAGVAQTLVLQGIPAVIAMQFEIIESAAITFAQEFYGSVADGFPVDAAVSEARKAIFARGNDVEWGTPVLYMRTPQGVIFEIPETSHDRPSATEEPEVFIDKEFEQKLEQLYTEGLAAFWVEDWDKACDRFQRILSNRPDHKAAADKLAEAKRQRTLSALYARALESQKAENWTAAAKALEELLKDAPEYKDAAIMLKAVKKQKQLTELYAEAKQLHEAQKWQAVAKVFAQIKSIEPNYPDPESLMPSLEKELEELKRQAELNDLYSRAVRAMDTSHWDEARELFQQIQMIGPDFMETKRLLSKVETKIQKSEQERNRQDQINTLYEQANGLLRSKKWRQALEKIEEIRKLDDQFEDPEKIAERAQVELTREEQEAERQNELAAMYAEAVRLVREEKYQEALETWQEIRGIDPKYPDRQWVQRTAKKQLASLARPGPVIKNQMLAGVKIEWLVILAAIGFGFARFVLNNVQFLFHTEMPLIPLDLAWALRGLIDGLITVFVLMMLSRDRKWQTILTFALCWSVLYIVVHRAVLAQSALILTSLVFSLAPILSILIASLWTRNGVKWPTYLLIFMGWILAWTIGQSVAGYLLSSFVFKWSVSDALAGGIGLWITTELLKETPGIFKPTIQTGGIFTTLIILLVAGGYFYQSNTDPFAGAIGKWEAIDVDGSYQTLSISRSFWGKYSFRFYDDRAGFCGGNPGWSEYSAYTDINVVHVPFEVICVSVPAKTGIFESRLTYDADIDQIFDQYGIAWQRIQ